jgi:hypothetical protein
MIARTLLSTAAVLATLATPALANDTTLARSSKWMTYVATSSGGSVCGMRATWPSDGRTMYIKYYDGAIRIHLLKKSTASSDVEPTPTPAKKDE